MGPCVQYQSDFCLCCLWSSSAWLYSWRTCRLCFCDYKRQHCMSFNTNLLSQPSENPWFYNGTVPARLQMCSWEVCLHGNAASASVCFFQIAASSTSRLSVSDAAPRAELPEKVALSVTSLFWFKNMQYIVWAFGANIQFALKVAGSCAPPLDSTRCKTPRRTDAACWHTNQRNQLKFHRSIFYHSITIDPALSVAGTLEPIPALIGQRQGTPWIIQQHRETNERSYSCSI